MEYFVFYKDDYYENGGVDLRRFKNLGLACQFIEERIKQNPEERDVSDYILIRGEELTIEIYKSVDKIKIVK